MLKVVTKELHRAKELNKELEEENMKLRAEIKELELQIEKLWEDCP